MDARISGHRVEALSLRSETSQTFVNPDGSFTTESTDGVTRVPDASAKDGWRDIDLTLVKAADGSLVPASPVDSMTLNGGGSGSGSQPLVSLSDGTGANSASLSWPDGDLPAPVVSGDTATYKNVRPGQDLVVQATRTGFEQTLVLTSKPVNAAAAQLALPITTHGLSFVSKSTGDGTSIDLETKAGKVVGGTGPALVSDAQVNAASGAPAHTEIAQQVLQTVAGKQSLVVSPSQSFLDSAVYPVTVDPSVSFTPLQDMYVDSGFPTTNYNSSTLLHVGTYDSGTHVARAFVKFTSVPIAGTQILSSTLKLWEEHAYNCTAASFTVYQASTPDYAALTWNTQPSTTTPTVSVSSAAGGGTSCPAASVSVNAQPIVQAFATANQNQVAFGIKASETNNAFYKRFNSANMGSNIPTLSVTYNHYAGIPASMSVAGQYTVNSVPYVKYSNPTLQGASTDADGEAVTLVFELYNANSTASTALVGSCTVTGAASGALKGCAVGKTLTDNKAYYWRAGSHDSHTTTFRYSALKSFTTAIAAPAAPVISCPSPYTNGSWQQASPGASVSCTVKTSASSLSSAPVKITTSVDGAAAVSTTVTKGSAGSVTVTVSNKTGSHKITAYSSSVDAVNSATQSYAFGYGAASISSPASGYKTTDTVNVTSSGPPLGTATNATAQLQWSGPGVDWTALGTPVAASATSTGGPVQPAAPFTWDTTTATGATLNPRLLTTLQLRVEYVYSTVVGTTTTKQIQDSQPITVLRLPHAFGNGFPQTSAGDGQVALWTGEFSVSASDVSQQTSAGALSLSRSFSSFSGPGNASTGVFGPGWTASLDGSGIGYAGVEVDDENASLGATAAAVGSLTLAGTSDGDLVYAPPASATGPSPVGTYTAVDDDTAAVGNTVTVTQPSGSSVKTLTVTQPDGTKSTWTQVAGSWSPAGVAQAGQQGSTTYTVDGLGRVTRILAALPNGVSCSSSLSAGCAALSLTYASATTATASVAADYSGRLKEVDFTAFDPATGAMKTVPVATYIYTSTGLLNSFTDKSGLTTTYTYQLQGSSTLLTEEVTTGSAPYFYTYDSAGKLLHADRGPASGSGSSVRTGTFAYGLSPTAAGMPDMSAATIADWAQTDVPTKAFAAWGMDYTPANIPVAADFPFANLFFTDDNGYTLNTANYGAGQWLLTAQAYDSDGNPTTSLTAAQTSDAVAQAVAGNTYDPTVGQTYTRYLAEQDDPTNAGGAPLVAANSNVEDTWGPIYQVTNADGTTTPARLHVHYVYDTGAPNGDVNSATGKPYLLPTEVLVTVADGSVPDTTPSSDVTADMPTTEQPVSDTVYGYNPIDGASSTGPTSGWTLGKATTTTEVLSSSSEPNKTTKTLFDAQGNTIQTQADGSNGADALTTLDVPYTAGANSQKTTCGNHPEWAGLTCWTGPAGKPDSGAELVGTLTAGYDFWLNSTVTVESSGTAATRTTTDTYLADGRPDTETVTATGLTGSTPVPETKALYDTTTLQQVGTETLDASGAATGQDTSTYDSWGRQVTYRNTLDEPTTTAYVPAGQPGAGQVQSVVTPVSTSTYTYDGTDAAGNVEHRGLVTGLTVSGVGHYSAAYDQSGNLVTQDLPAGVTQTLGYDDSGRVTDLTYSGDITDPDTGAVTQGPWLSFSRDYNGNGQVLDDSSPSGSRQYTYDGAGRLISVADATGADTGADSGACTVRQYAFDPNGNRTSLTLTSAPDQCTTDSTQGGATQTVSAWTYDAESRQLTSANDGGNYAYDAFGRQAIVPAADAPNPALGDVALSYYDTDAAHTISQGGVVTTYGLDPSERRLTADTTGGDNPGTVTNHYADGSDNPAWATNATSTGVTTTAYTPGIGASMAAQVTTQAGGTAQANLELADLAGNIVTSVPVPASGNAQQDQSIGAYTAMDEYGNIETAAGTSSALPDTGVDQYGYLGTSQRAQAGAGLTLMGARIYNSTTGRFTSADPVVGGNENAYNYPNDPINQVDINGMMSAHARHMWNLFINVLGTLALLLWLVGFAVPILKLFSSAVGALAVLMSCAINGWGIECWFNVALTVIAGVTGKAIARVLAGPIKAFAYFLRDDVSEFLDNKLTAYGLVLQVVSWFEYLASLDGRYRKQHA